jgi:hypothetical protein
MLNSRGHSLSRILHLRSRQPNILSPTEGESRHHQDGTDAFEAVVECTRIVPVCSTKVALVADGTCIDQGAKDAEADDLIQSVPMKADAVGARLLQQF